MEVSPKMSKTQIKIQNIVASTYLGHDIPLVKLAETLPNTEYNPEQFPGLVMRIRDPKTSALIFSSGKVVCTGAKSMTKVKEAVQAIIKNVEKIKIKVTIKPKIQVQNMVASGSIGMDLNLNELAMKLLPFAPRMEGGLSTSSAEQEPPFFFSAMEKSCAREQGQR